MIEQTHNGAGKHKYILNFSRMKKIRDKFLTITEQGGWALMGNEDRKMLLRNNLPEKLFKILEKAGIIITEDNINHIINQEYKRRHINFVPPGLHIILPTLRCNQKCIYCHSSAKQDGTTEFDMDEETARKTVDFIVASSSEHFKVEFQGGDSLLNFERMKQIINYTKDSAAKRNKKARFSVVTNLIAMNDEMLDWLIKNKVDITSSLDGPKNVHDYNRRYIDGRGTYEDLIEKISFCRKKGAAPGLLMVTTRYSLDYPREIVDEYIKLGMNDIQLKFLNNIGYARDEWKQIGYSAEEYLTFWKLAMEHIIKRNKEGKRIIERFSRLVLIKIIKGYEPGFLDFCSPCGAVRGQLAYNYNGDIYSCDEGRGFDIFKLGNVHQSTYKQIMSEKTTQNLIASSILEVTSCDACTYKPYCNTCPVLNYAEGGTPIAKLASNERCKIMKGKIDWIFEKILFEPEDREVLLRWISN
jgi:uncharacterized protein